MWKVLVPPVAALLLLAWPWAAAPAAASAPSYRLGTGDQIRLKVYEWRRATGDVYDWKALNSDFRVGPDGTLSLPLLGAVPAAGASIDELSETISTRLQQAVGLAARPLTSVEVVQFRPFYILGSVHHPGEYRYRPGLRVLQAVSIAGGTFRIDDPGLLLFRRSLLTASGDLHVLVLEYEGLLARRARLQGELNGSPKIAFPRELLDRQNEPEVAQAMQREEAMFAARRDALQSETASLDRLKGLLSDEVTALQSKTKDVDQEVALLKQELAQTAALVQKGLAPAPREFSLRQTELQTEGRRLDLDTAILRAREEIGKTEQSLIKLRDKMRGEIMAELSAVEQKLADHAARIKTGKTIAQQEAEAPDFASVLDMQSGPLTYSIIRQGPGGSQKIAATEASEVEPGDTIEVRRAAQAEQSEAAGADVADLVGSSTEAPPPATAKPPAAGAHAKPHPVRPGRNPTGH